MLGMMIYYDDDTRLFGSFECMPVCLLLLSQLSLNSEICCQVHIVDHVCKLSSAKQARDAAMTATVHFFNLSEVPSCN